MGVFLFIAQCLCMSQAEIPRVLDAMLEKQEVNVACVTGSEWSTAQWGVYNPPSFYAAAFLIKCPVSFVLIISYYLCWLAYCLLILF